MVRVNTVSHLCSIMVVIFHCALVASGLSERGKQAGTGQRGLTGGGGCIAGCERSHDRITGRGFPKTWGYSNPCAGMPPKPAKKLRNSSSGVNRHRRGALRGCGGGPSAPFHAQHPPIASRSPNIPPTPSHPPNTPPMLFHPPNTPIMPFCPSNTPLMPSLPPNIPPTLSLSPNILLTPSRPPDTSSTPSRCVGWMSAVGVGLVGVGVWGASWRSCVGIGFGVLSGGHSGGWCWGQLLRHTKPITRLLWAYKNQTTEM